MTTIKSRRGRSSMLQGMERARALRTWPGLGALLVFALGCGGDAPSPDGGGASDVHVHDHDHTHDAADDAADVSEAPDVHEHTRDAPDASEASPDASGDARVDVADAPRDRSRDLDLRLGGWTAERGRRVELRLVGADGALTTLVVLRAVATGTERFVLADAMSAAPARLDWYVDGDGDGRYGTADTASHAPAPTAPPYALTLAAGAAPGDPAPLPTDRADLVGHLGGFAVHVGVRFELTVTAVGSERTVALFRDEATTGADNFEVRLPHVLRAGEAYRVFLFIDLNDNGVYDLHGDHGSSLEGTATAGGLTFGHDHHTNRTWWE